MKKVIVFFFLVIGAWNLIAQPVIAQEKITVDFFYSVTCPHCIQEQSFLDKLEKENKDIKINRYEAAKNVKLLREYYKKYNISLMYQGAVPITFIKNKYFLGFNDQIGEDIKNFILGNKKKDTGLIGKINPKKYSLPVLAVILGVVDGFNVCSLGALIIILTLVLSLRSRKKIFVFGSTYLITTALVYGGLIFFWYQLFNFITPYIRKMEIVIGLVTLVAGIYFIREFIDAYKKGPNCKIDEGKKMSGRFSTKFKKMVEETEKLLPMILSVLIFAAAITIVEFPCSAAVPLVFAGILSKAHLPTFIYLFYMFIYLVFYLLDEIIVFLVAVFSMKLWLSSPKFVTWIILLQAIIMFLLSSHYLFGVI